MAIHIPATMTPSAPPSRPISTLAPFLLTFIAALIGAAPLRAEANQDALHRSWEIYAHPQRLVDVGGHRLNLYCIGHGSPTVILDGGLGNTITTWRYVQRPISRTTRVCSYDRAGYGFSDVGPMPRTAAILAAELDALLRNAHIRAPFVVVGGSLASLHVRLFTDQHLNEVKGMVLVDPSFEHQVARFGAATPAAIASAEQQRATLRSCIEALRSGPLTVGSQLYSDCIGGPNPDLPDDVNNAIIAREGVGRFEMTLSEIEEFEGVSGDQVDASRRTYGDMPLIILTADVEANADADALTRTQIWRAMHDQWAQLSSRGVNRIIPNSNHNIQVSQPEAVIAAVNEVVAAARAARR